MTMEAAVDVKDNAKKGLHSSIATVACERQCLVPFDEERRDSTHGYDQSGDSFGTGFYHKGQFGDCFLELREEYSRKDRIPLGKCHIAIHLAIFHAKLE